MKGLNEALQGYIERELIKKLKQNTWNWVVANKIEYVNFMANNYDKFKNWYIKNYLQHTDEGEDKQIEQIIFSKKIFYKMMHNFGVGKDIETLD